MKIFTYYDESEVETLEPVFANTLDELCDEFQSFCAENNLPQMSADELFQEKYEVLTEEQKTYILGFIEQWEALEEMY